MAKKKTVTEKEGSKPPARKRRALPEGRVDPFSTFEAQIQKAKPTANKPRFHWKDSVVSSTDLLCQEGVRQSTGNFALDVAMFNGYPKGIIGRVYGLQRSCKTGTCYNMIAEWQKNCNLCFVEECDCPVATRLPAGCTWVDAEGKTLKAVNLERMVAHGIDVSRVNCIQPDCGDEVVDAIEEAIKAGVGLIILDSLAHVIPKVEINKSVLNNEKIAAQAKIVSRAMRKWVSAINGQKDTGAYLPTVWCINQLRTGGLGSPTGRTYDMQTGGKAANYATSLDVKLRSSEKYDRGYFYRSAAGNEIYTTDWKKVVEFVGKDKHVILGNLTPSYINVSFEITSSSHSLPGRSGTFRYWIDNVDGHRHGEVDNLDSIMRYAEAYNWMAKKGSKWALTIPEDEMTRWGYEKAVLATSTSKKDLVSKVKNDRKLFKTLWRALINMLSRS